MKGRSSLLRKQRYLLKTLADWTMHLTEHAEREKKGTPSASPSDRIQAL